MCYEKDCYFCRNLCFLDDENVHDFFCTITGKSFPQNAFLTDCENFIEDREE